MGLVLSSTDAVQTSKPFAAGGQGLINISNKSAEEATKYGDHVQVVVVVVIRRNSSFDSDHV